MSTVASQNGTEPSPTDCLMNAAQTVSDAQTTVTVHYDRENGHSTVCDPDGLHTETGDDLRDAQHWVCWAYEKRGDDRTKPPIAPFDSTHYASTDDPSTWATHNDAIAYHQRSDADTEGVGYMLASSDRIFGIDGDGCRDPETGAIEPWMQDIIDQMNTYTEISPSGTGIRIIGIGELPDGLLDGANRASQPRTLDVLDDCEKSSELEMYATDRYLTITGDQLDGTPSVIREGSGAFETVHEEYIGRSTDQPSTNSSDSTSGGKNVQVHNFSSDIELVPHHELGAEQVSTYTNAFDKPLDHCRSIDDYLDELLSEKYPDGLETDKGELLTDTNRIEEKLVSRLRYHWFDRQQQADILRCYRQQFRDDKPQKLNRTDYVRRTVEKYADDVRRWYYDDSFSSHIIYRQDNTAPITADSSSSSTTDATAPPTNEHVSQQEARDRCQKRINRTFDNGMRILCDAVPSLGKSSGTIRAVEQTDVPATVLTARHDLYDQYCEWADKHDLSAQTLPSLVRDCPSMTGNHGEMWQERMETLYEMGVAPAQIHRKAEYEFGSTPPCTRDGSCEYTDNYPSNIENLDVIVGHYTHAHNSALTDDRMVVFDEFIGQNFIDDWESHESMGEVVSSWLNGFDDPPVTDSDGLIEARGNSDRYERVVEWIDDHATIDLNAISTDTSDNQHMLAPVLAKGLLTADNHGNGWESSTVEIPRRIGDDDVTETFQFARNRVQKRTCVLNSPSLENVHGIIALDGTPSKLWDIALDETLFRLPVLKDDERQEYIRHVLGMKIVPLTDNNAYHVSGATNAEQHHERDQTLYDTIDSYHDESPSLITSDNMLEYHEENKMLQSIDDHMKYEAIVSSNSFGKKTLGIVNGSPHLGDDYCKLWAALDGDGTERVDGTEGMEQEFDSEIGQSALHQMRESQVAQAILRFGRDESVNSSTVYVNTGAIPEWLPVDGHGDIVKASDRRTQVIGALINGTDRDVDHDYLTYDDIEDTDYLNVSKSSVKRTMSELADYGYIKTEQPINEPKRYIPTSRLHELIRQ